MGLQKTEGAGGRTIKVLGHQTIKKKHEKTKKKKTPPQSGKNHRLVGPKRL